MAISTCVVFRLSAVLQLYQSLIEIRSFQRSLEGRDYSPPLAIYSTAVAHTERNPNLNLLPPAWKLSALLGVPLRCVRWGSCRRNGCQSWTRPTDAPSLLILTPD